MFSEKGILENITKFTKEHLRLSHFLKISGEDQQEPFSLTPTPTPINIAENNQLPEIKVLIFFSNLQSRGSIR